MLAGRWAVPTPDPTGRGTVPLAGLALSPTLVAEVLPGEVSLGRLSADLSAYRQPLRWVSLTPYDLDPSAMDTLVTAMDTTEHPGPVVIEAPERGQAEQFQARLPHGSRDRVVILRHVQSRTRPLTGAPSWESALQRLTGPRVALHDSILAAGQRMPVTQFAAIVERSRSVDELTARLARSLLHHAPPKTATLLGLAALLGYHHPRFASLAPVLDVCASLPWWTDLSGGWRRLDPGWQRGVLAVCRDAPRPSVAILGRLVGELVEDGATGSAIELCLDAGYPGIAGDLLDGIGPDLLGAGSTLALRRWLGRLPWTERLRHRLLSTQVRASLRTPARTSPLGPSLVSPSPVPPSPIPPSVAPSSPVPPWVVPPPVVPPPVVPPSLVPPSLVPLLLVQPDAPSPAPADVEARLLGPLEVSVEGRAVGHWHGRKGQLLLAYLLLRRNDPPIARDALAAAFWPDAPPEASRNRLHVTLHALRADLQTASPLPVIQFGGGYRINPALNVVLDTEQFERAAARAATAEAARDLRGALRAYRDAADRYRGDLLGDYPFEDWTFLDREHFRARHLDLLGRMAQVAFDSGQYAQTLDIGRRLLALDFCREDLHRLLMRAHTRMGRPQAAVQQFETCTDQLRRELGMAPAHETIDLYERIRARSPV